MATRSREVQPKERNGMNSGRSGPLSHQTLWFGSEQPHHPHAINVGLIRDPIMPRIGCSSRLRSARRHIALRHGVQAWRSREIEFFAIPFSYRIIPLHTAFLCEKPRISERVCEPRERG